MARSVSWRRSVSDTVSWRQDQALNATIYILRQTGPTGFLLKEEGENKKFKVLIGDPHKCTCPIFNKEKDLCKHICWILLKKFRVPRQNPVTWQMGLVEREINEILRGGLAHQEARTNHAARKYASVAAQMGRDPESGRAVMAQREIGQDDVCPICQDELLEKHLPVTFCKFGCGNNVHIKCMKVWADHQKSQGKTIIECPFCREDFGPISLLKQEMRNSSQRETRAERMNEHLGTTCRKCHVCPITGKCYKCSVCADFYLCQACFNTPIHTDHSFLFRQKVSQRWRSAPSRSGTMLPQAVINNLMSRDISEDDYDLLLQLDNQSSQQMSDLTEETIRSFPMERVRANHPLLAPGQQCCICLRGYDDGQFVRRLPCQHKYHRECIDDWLMHRHPTCPIDGTVFTNESVQQMREANKARLRQLQRERSQQNQQQQQEGNPVRTLGNVPNLQPISLEIPGVGIAHTAAIGHGLSSSSRANNAHSVHSHGNTLSSGSHGNVVDPMALLVQNLQGQSNAGQSRSQGRSASHRASHGRRHSNSLRRPGSEGNIQQEVLGNNISGLSLGQVIGVNIQQPTGDPTPSGDLEDSIIDFIANDNQQRQGPERILDNYSDVLNIDDPQNHSYLPDSHQNSQNSNQRGSGRRNRSEDELMEIVSVFSGGSSRASSGHNNDSMSPNLTLLFDPNEQQNTRAKERLRSELGLGCSKRDRVADRLNQQRTIRPAGRLSEPSHGPLGRTSDVNINISGHSALTREGSSSANEAGVHLSPGQNLGPGQMDITPQPPSIPSGQQNGLDLGIGTSANQNHTSPAARKPPSGDNTNHGYQRHRSGAPHRENNIDRSHSRENSGSRNGRNLQNLYIGSRPNGIVGFNSEFLLSSNESRSSNIKRSAKVKQTKSGPIDGRPTIEANGHINDRALYLDATASRAEFASISQYNVI